MGLSISISRKKSGSQSKKNSKSNKNNLIKLDYLIRSINTNRTKDIEQALRNDIDIYNSELLFALADSALYRTRVQFDAILKLIEDSNRYLNFDKDFHCGKREFELRETIPKFKVNDKVVFAPLKKKGVINYVTDDNTYYVKNTDKGYHNDFYFTKHGDMVKSSNYNCIIQIQQLNDASNTRHTLIFNNYTSSFLKKRDIYQSFIRNNHNVKNYVHPQLTVENLDINAYIIKLIRFCRDWLNNKDVIETLQHFSDYIYEQRRKELYVSTNSVSNLETKSGEESRTVRPSAPPRPTVRRVASTRFDSLNCCTVCYDKPPTIVYYPCGHLTNCKDCATKFKTGSGKCPICRAVIMDKITPIKQAVE